MDQWRGWCGARCVPADTCILGAMAWDLTVVIPLIISVLTAVGFSSLLSQWASGAKDRQIARAAALDALRKVEEERWFGSGSDSTTFKAAIRELETSMLLACVPAAPVALYVALASAAHGATRSDYEEDPQPDGGTLSRSLSDYVKRTARIILRYIWSPRGLHRIPDRIKLRYVKYKAKRMEGETGRFIAYELSKVGASR